MLKRLFVAIVCTFLINSCDVYQSVEHAFYFRNLSMDTLRFNYRSVDMEEHIEVFVAPGYEDTYRVEDVVDGDDPLLILTNEEIIAWFDSFHVINHNDTLHLNNTNIDSWMNYYEENINNGVVEHAYIFSIHNYHW